MSAEPEIVCWDMDTDTDGNEYQDIAVGDTISLLVRVWERGHRDPKVLRVSGPSWEAIRDAQPELIARAVAFVAAESPS